jgi:hypothetical protein
MSNDNGKNIVGSIGSTAAIGAAVGSIIPGLGSAVGAVAGGAIGVIMAGISVAKNK